MGIFGFFQGETAKRAEDVRSGAVAPTRQERQRCYVARDAYFACLDAAEIIDSIKHKDQAARACGTQGKAFEQECAAEWVRFILHLLECIIPSVSAFSR
jgi:cytochrome c oxidase assembly factor 6